LKLVGFPAQWIPVCAHYGISCAAPRRPLGYLPLFSDMPVAEIVRVTEAAKARNASRPLLEAAAALDPVIADLVYIVDHKLAASGVFDPGNGGSNLLNTWHSFGRPEVIELQERMCRHRAESDVGLFLPCSRQRPYEESRTHARLLRNLSNQGYEHAACSQIVVTAFGVVPRTYWRHPLIMSYDAGAVDLWRVFQLLRAFLAQNRFRLVIGCLSFKPFSDMLNTLHELQLIPRPVRPLKIRWRGFSAKTP
jgi:predicted RNA-binding protein